MILSKSAVNLKHGATNLRYNNIVDYCPVCHYKGVPGIASALWKTTEGISISWLVYQCPNEKCQEVFLGRFKKSLAGHMEIVSLSPLSPTKSIFPPEIIDVSPVFKEIYDQALAAESYGLDHISGPGFRKALEFLIKDYAVWLTPEKKDEIQKALLAPVIKNHISDARIIAAASRAAWLGNDETHYQRRWIQKDITDLKNLISITVNSLHSDIALKKYQEEMPS